MNQDVLCILDAVTKGTKCYSVDRAAAAEVDLQEREVVDDGRSHGHDDEERRGGKQQHRAEVVKECSDTHCGKRSSQATITCV